MLSNAQRTKKFKNPKPQTPQRVNNPGRRVKAVPRAAAWLRPAAKNAICISNYSYHNGLLRSENRKISVVMIHYPGHRGGVVDFPGQGPSSSRRFPKSEALAEDFGNLRLVQRPRPGNSTTAPRWPG